MAQARICVTTCHLSCATALGDDSLVLWAVANHIIHHGLKLRIGFVRIIGDTANDESFFIRSGQRRP